jgi:hypothetical protein
LKDEGGEKNDEVQHFNILLEIYIQNKELNLIPNRKILKG